MGERNSKLIYKELRKILTRCKGTVTLRQLVESLKKQLPDSIILVISGQVRKETKGTGGSESADETLVRREKKEIEYSITARQVSGAKYEKEGREKTEAILIMDGKGRIYWGLIRQSECMG